MMPEVRQKITEVCYFLAAAAAERALEKKLFPEDISGEDIIADLEVIANPYIAQICNYIDEGSHGIVEREVEQDFK